MNDSLYLGHFTAMISCDKDCASDPQRRCHIDFTRGIPARKRFSKY